MTRHSNRLHSRLKWQQNLYNRGTKSSSSSYKMQYGIFTIVKTRFKATHCHAWSSSHKGKSLWSDQNPAQKASLFLNKQALPHFSLVWLIPDSVLHWVHFLELSSGTRSRCRWDAGAPQEYHFMQQHGKEEMLNWEKLRAENQVEKCNVLEYDLVTQACKLLKSRQTEDTA